MDKTFIVDSNILIRASRVAYGFDFCPGFWDIVRQGFESGVLTSHKMVFDEIKRGGDGLWDWLSEIPKACFPDATGEEFEVYLAMQEWAKGRDYRRQALERFGADDYADPWVCAKAKVRELVLVTEEVSAPQSKRDVKIPDVCDAFGVAHCDTSAMLRDLGAVFILDPGRPH